MAVADPIIVSAGESEERLERTWSERGGMYRWFAPVHHTTIGKMYFVTAGIFLLLGGILAALIRIQLSRPENNFLGPDRYNQFFTVHGSTMIFLFAVPMMYQAFGVYLVPLMVGARNIAFPRLAAFSYFIYVGGCLLLWGGLLLNIGADAGWFSYVPLSGPAFSPGKRVDFWAQMITFTELSALAVAVCLIVTILKYRAPGMTLNRMPLLVWEKLVLSFMVIFAMPAVMLVSTMLLMDRTANTHFFNPAEGGDVLLYQHLFWFFGHPDVYIIFLPGAAIISTLVATFSRRHIFGYPGIVVATIATGFLGFGVWVHHMFATGIPQLSESFFTAATLMIVIPTAYQFFCWIATLWNGRPQLRLPMLWVGGFFFVFMIGGLSGLMLASVPVDLQVHDTFFVVAHFHYVLIGGAMFPMFAGIYYWFPKVVGRMAHEALAKVHFWLFFIGFNLTFFTMHFLGLRGMPRRIYTYLPEMHWTGLNQIATAGAGFMTLGILVFLINLFWSIKRGTIAGPNPWGAGSLEWSVPSPPPPYNFVHIPTVDGREAIWDAPPNPVFVSGIRDEVREVLLTNSLDAEPEAKEEQPAPSVWPFLTAVVVSAVLIGSIFTLKAVSYGALPIAFSIIAWIWPKEHEVEERREHEKWRAA